MRILFTSDIHVDDRHLEAMCSIAANQSIDCIIIGGDLIPHHTSQSTAEDLLEDHRTYLETVLVPRISELKQATSISIYLDLGNDDLFGARHILEVHDGNLFHLLHLRKLPLAEYVDIIGYMNVPPTPFQRKDWEKPDSKERPYEPENRTVLYGYASRHGHIEKTEIDIDSDDTIETDLVWLSRQIDRPFVFISHSPPYGTPLDVLANGNHVGSRSIRRFIEKWSQQGQLIVSLHGHIHESPFRSGSIQARIGKSLCFNPGQESGPAHMFRYVIFELEAKQTRSEIRILKTP